MSRWALEQPDAFDADDLRCWRIASPSWLRLADRQLAAVEHVERPVGVFVVPAPVASGWQLVPVLSLDAIRLVAALGGTLGRDLTAAHAARRRRRRAAGRGSTATRCTRGRRSAWTPRASSSQELARALGKPVPRARRATSATAGAACSCAARATPAATAHAAASSRCASSRSRARVHASAGSAPPRCPNGTPSRAR